MTSLTPETSAAGGGDAAARARARCGGAAERAHPGAGAEHRGARERADPGSRAQARRRRRHPDRHGDERDRPERHQVDPVLRHQGAAAADQHFGHDARGCAHQGHRAGRRRAQPHGAEAARARLRGHRPARQAELAGAPVRPQEPGAQIHRRVRGRARSDRQDHDRPRAAQDPAAHRHHQARQAVRRQPRLLPHARGVHRGRPRQAEGAGREDHPGDGEEGRGSPKT